MFEMLKRGTGIVVDPMVEADIPRTFPAALYGDIESLASSLREVLTAY